jgi:hypothetical protein
LLENRDPTLSENGSVYWIAYDTRMTDLIAITDLVRYQRGERTSMGSDRAIDFHANAKPTAQSNYVVWIADYRKFTTQLHGFWRKSLERRVILLKYRLSV